MTPFELLYSYSTITINLISGLILISIWIKVINKETVTKPAAKGNIDYGLFWLAVSFFCWAVLSTVTLLAFAFNLKPIILDSIRISLSMANNIFLLLAFPYFDHVPESLKSIQAYKRLPAIISIIGLLFAFISILLILSNPDNTYAFYFPGFLFSVLTGAAIGVALVNTFYMRGFKIISYLAAITMLLMIYSQLPSVWQYYDQQIGGTFWNSYLLLVPKVAFSIIILSLAMSKVHEMSETPASENLSLKFLGEQDGQYWKVALRIAKIKKNEKTYMLSTVEHENLLKFAVKKLQHGESEAANLYTQDFSSGYNAIKRIWQKLEVTRKDIFDYYPQSAKYRLRIPQNNIQIFNLDKLMAFEELRKILQDVNHA